MPASFSPSELRAPPGPSPGPPRGGRRRTRSRRCSRSSPRMSGSVSVALIVTTSEVPSCVTSTASEISVPGSDPGLFQLARGAAGHSVERHEPQVGRLASRASSSPSWKNGVPVNFVSRPGSRKSSEEEAVYSLLWRSEIASAAAGASTRQSRIRPRLRLMIGMTRWSVPSRGPSGCPGPACCDGSVRRFMLCRHRAGALSQSALPRWPAPVIGENAEPPAALPHFLRSSRSPHDPPPLTPTEDHLTQLEQFGRPTGATLGHRSKGAVGFLPCRRRWSWRSCCWRPQPKRRIACTGRTTGSRPQTGSPGPTSMAAAAAISTTAGAPDGRATRSCDGRSGGKGLLDGPDRQPDLLRQPRRERGWREPQHRLGHRQPRRTRLRSIRPRERSTGPTRTATGSLSRTSTTVRRWRSDHGRRDGGRPDRSRRRSRIRERIYWGNARPAAT